MKEKGKANSSNGIQGRREAVGLSRLGLAFKAGVSLRTIERIEAGEVDPRPATLAVIENALAEVTTETGKAAAA